MERSQINLQNSATNASYLLKNIAYTISAIFFFLLPLHAFLVTLFKFGIGLNSEAISLWREVLIGLLTILAMLLAIKKMRQVWPMRFRSMCENCSSLDILIFIFFLFGIFFFFYKRDSISQWMLGARYDFEFFYFYLLMRYFRFTKNELKTFVKMSVIGAIIVILFGFLTLALSQNALKSIGYGDYLTEWKSGNPVYACHYLEFDQSFCRMQSTFGSPGRYANYLLFVIAITSTYLISTTKKNHQIFWIALLIGAFLSLYLTLARSAWIGALAMIIVGMIPIIRNMIKKTRALKIIVTGAILIIIVSVLLTKTNFIQSIKPILMRQASSSEHIVALKQGLQIALKNPLGIGLGKAGPASQRFQKFLTENTYLQVIVEMGFVAGALFIIIFFSFIKKLVKIYKKNQSRTHQIVSYACYLTLIGIMVSGLFVHAFEEMSLMLTLFGLIGILDQKEYQEYYENFDTREKDEHSYS